MPRNGNWGRWNEWTWCSKTCGGGRRTRHRTCNDTSPIAGGLDCNGVSRDDSSCSSNVCPGIIRMPMNGNWGRWNEWTWCSKTCGGGRRTRHRNCNDPSPIAGGLDCNGVSRDDSSCSSNVCPVNGNWGRWNGWTGCSKTCGGGRRTRHRTCNDPSPIAGGLDCNGVSRDDSSCSSNVCPEWTNWNLWDSCTVDCGFGTRSRNRVCQHCVHGNCNAVDNKQCRGNSDEKETCSVISCTGRLYDSLTIGCDLEQKHRNIAWSKTWNFLRDIRNKYEETTSYLLKILNLQYTDNGTYRCSVWNGQKHNYGIFINLNVYGAPQVTILRQSHFVQIGTKVTFVCNIQSNPPISELWWTDNQAHIITDKLRYNGGHIHNHNLSIISVKDSDSGVYTCNANNTKGTSKATTTLITGNISQTTILGDLYVAIDEQDITLECLIKTDPSNNVLYWLKNGKDLRPYLSSKYSGGTLSEQSLTIKNVDNNDAGNYTCKLENQFGTSKDVVELKVLYVPLVYQSSDTIKAFTGDTITLKCVYESNPEPSVVFWKRDGEILNVSVSKYNGSTINEPSLTIVNIDHFDSGAYVCAVVNNIGTGYSSKILLLIKEKVLTSADKVPVVVGTVLSVAVFLFILFTVLVLLMKRRRVKKKQESSYETNEMINAETHAYGKTDTYHDYCNSNMKQTPATKNDISLMEGDCLLKKYNVIELTNRLNNAESLEARIRAEFMFLETKSVKVDMTTNDYEIVLKENQTGVPKKEAKTLYMKQSVDDIFIFSSFPDDRNVEQFWSMIINHHIENIIMIVQKSEKTTSFCPTHEDVFKVAMLEIEMRSAEKTNDNICMLRFILHDKKSRTKHHVKIFKTNWDDSDKYPPIENMCSLLDKVKIEEGRPTLMTGSKGKSLSVCGAVSLCLHSVRAIERETTFSLLEYATLLKRIEDDFIKVFEDYEFCYKVMAQYLETIHTYSFIE
ncbi:uncharacterized protein [Mytilus edulis]|uniref:uncharacterized protein n=1 Tax=Mytilus edulis TaxID=6550 RepID=UPI0039EE073A